ncbi:right-handed parallel beta-helix repeat-containing protein [Burkholderia lata]|uniref:right-handed parallel beta-helix repeat-containing protein n=1 Tax=Burkholderia lata (strain ATCC 17760 / DSM 23089 / LMG 22485 / NCIMB 9086 / R18194 / 383) TaxID=482957 RepID=UPI00158398A0|nr:right-handed parallel beta-helix repeat-containing protein [Burkholderia lata]
MKYWKIVAAPLIGALAACGGGESADGVAAGQQLAAAPASEKAADETPGTLHVDCSLGSNGTGSPATLGSAANPIHDLATLNRIVLTPGMHVRFKRGTTCEGSFTPARGSTGAAGAPIVVDAYGDPKALRPVIAAGCADAAADPDQSITEQHKTPSGFSGYYSLCKSDNPTVNRAAIYLFNTQYWEIRSLELTNDATTPGGRLGLYVRLEDYGTGSHYHVDDVYVHHVRGYLKDVAGNTVGSYKTTGGMLFEVTRDNEVVGTKGKRTGFDDIAVENSEIYNVDAVALSTRSAWMCREGGAPCGDYPPYKGNSAYLKNPATQAATDYFPTTRVVFRNNLIHNVGGDGIIVRTATAPQVEANHLYDIWMRAPGNSAGAWAINTDDALFRYNEVNGVRLQNNIEAGDGMAFDADLGTRNTRVAANFSHDNDGGLMLFCGCGSDGLGHVAQETGAIVENNLSLNDKRRIVSAAGSADSVVRDNVVITRTPGLITPIVENLSYANAFQVTGNRFYNASDSGAIFRTKNPQGSYANLVWSGNTYFGYAADPEFTGPNYRHGAQPDTVLPFAGQDVDAVASAWSRDSGFDEHKYRAPHAR